MIGNNIEFDSSKWESVAENNEKWWNHELDRPLIHVYLKGKKTSRKPARLVKNMVVMSYGLDESEQDIIDSWDYDLCCTQFLGDAFPWYRPLFGSSAMAVYIGTQCDASPETVWYHPWGEDDISKIRIQYDSNHPWFLKTKRIYRQAIDKWNGTTQLCIPNIGGVFDILTMIMPTEKLLLEMYDHPDEVQRLVREVHETWWKYFNELNELIRPNNCGYVGFWLPMVSSKPTFILQNDLICMLSPYLFEKFVLPELVESSNKLGASFFHLDGPGALAHLDSLLKIKSLKGVQWIPGDGAKPVTEWSEVFRKIKDAGKLIHLDSSGDMETLNTVSEQLGGAEGIIYQAFGKIEEKEDFERWLDKYQVESYL